MIGSEIKIFKLLQIVFLLLISEVIYISCDPALNEPFNAFYHCGDSVKEDGEVCDGNDLGDTTCKDISVPGFEERNFLRGELLCQDDCLGFIITECNGFCGDNRLDGASLGGHELCDGIDLGEITCRDLSPPDYQNQKYYSGIPICKADCSGFERKSENGGEYLGCKGYCGDGEVNKPSAGGDEICDGENLSNKYDDDGNLIHKMTCSSIYVPNHPGKIYYFGELKCLPDCSGYDTSDCNGYCGDGRIDDDMSDSDAKWLIKYPEGCEGDECMDFHEVCDGENLADASCLDYGYSFGTPTCSETCAFIDYSTCKGFCGDGICEPQYGETYDNCINDCFLEKK